MQALNRGYSPGAYPMLQSNNLFLDDFSTQMAISEASRRLSRQSNNQRNGSTMRISKPSSANISPRASLASSRRRTMVSGGHPSPPLQPYVDYLPMAASEAAKRPSRPVSWHPGSQMYAQQAYVQQQQTGYPTHISNMHPEYPQDVYGGLSELSPMMAAYSATNSPGSNFSPLSSGLSSDPAYLASDGWTYSQEQAHYFPSLPASQPLAEVSPSSGYLDNEAQNNAAWTTYGHGVSNTSPPTPDSFIQTQQQPVVSEHAMPYQGVDEAEEEGEILVGMGLYDSPEKHDEDPHLNNYRSTVNSLLGPAYRPQEPMGKGLKLEETWEPPQSDDEEEDEGDEDESDDLEVNDETNTSTA